MTAGARCGQPGCGGTVLADGYCDTCGSKATPPKPKAAAPASAPSAAASVAPTVDPSATGASGSTPISKRRRTGSIVTGSARARGTRRKTASGRTARSSSRTAIGAGLVEVPPAPAVDPSKIVMADPEVAEEKRFCSSCGAPVGRSRDGKPGRVTGFCGKCRNPYDFVPKLAAGDLVGGQYQVIGPIAHGGLGWIYLAQDKAVSDRWVVLKGLLDAGDEAATIAAVAERRFLAEVEHPNIVEIYNFVTHRGAGYIVMEYVGGLSLKQLLKQRRAANNDQPNPLPPEQAMAYILAVLPAFTYLHSRGLVYCDFKPDNMIQVADQVKLIDLGGVRRVDDHSGDVYGTVGFQAPEIADMGPSVASDVYTIGRTLAVLTLDFRGYQSTYEHALPDPTEHDVLGRFGSFHRLLLKATAPHPDDRFTSVHELSEQLLGVLREVVALTTGSPQPGRSSSFAVTSTGAGTDLPPTAVDPGDPAGPFLANLPPDDPAAVLAAIADGLAAGHVTETVEVRLRQARALLEVGRRQEAMAVVDAVEEADPWEWRATWLRGIAALHAGDHDAAAEAFERCQVEVPGELVPKLAAAMTAERSGDHVSAADLYDRVSVVDPTFVEAIAGLARCRLAAGDVAGALAAYGRVPTTHRAHGASQLAAARTLIAARRLAEAAAVLERIDAGAHAEAQLEVELFEAGVDGIGRGAVKPDPDAQVLGAPVTERGLRLGLERAYRRLARLTTDDAERHRLIDRANAVRPVTVV